MSNPIDTLSPPQRSFLGFDSEREAYARCRKELLETARGQFVVFVGDRMIGPFATEDVAERAGYEEFGLGPLYIKLVHPTETVVTLPLGVQLCQS